MAYGEDTEELMRRINAFINDILNISDLNITSIPYIPEGVERLFCYHTNITSLPPLPKSLKLLNCSCTQITELPELPSKLETLFCSFVQIKKLPILPEGFKYLILYKTNITTLPELPSSLKQLYCEYNPIISIPSLPNGLKQLKCNNTLIKELPNLPESLDWINVWDTNLPFFKSVNETVAEYNTRLQEYQDSVKRTKERAKTIHEELVASVWRPDRLKKLLEAGGWDLVEAM